MTISRFTGRPTEDLNEKISEIARDPQRRVTKYVIFDGQPVKVEASAEDIDAAFAIAESQIPPTATAVEKQVLAERKDATVIVDEFSERSASNAASRQVDPTMHIVAVSELQPSRNGFLGIGKRAGKYEVHFRRPARVSITFHHVPLENVVVTVNGTAAPSLAELIEQLGSKNETNVSNATELLPSLGYGLQAEPAGLIVAREVKVSVFDSTTEWQSWGWNNVESAGEYVTTVSWRRHKSKWLGFIPDFLLDGASTR